MSTSLWIELVAGIAGSLLLRVYINTLRLGPILSLTAGLCGGAIGAVVLGGLIEVTSDPFSPLHVPALAMLIVAGAAGGFTIAAIIGMMREGIMLSEQT